MEDIKAKGIEIEVEGKTVAEAVKKAVAQLKVPKSQMNITILAEEQRGLFGMQGAKPAKIRARVVPQTPKKKS